MTKVKAKAKPAPKPRVKPVPDGTRTVTPHLVCGGAADAIEFYNHAFGAVEMMRLAAPDGKLMHACIMIGDTPVFLVDEFPGHGSVGPKILKGSPVTLHLSVEDADAFAARGRSGSQDDDAAHGYVLGRPLWPACRPVRPLLVGCHAPARYDG